MIDAESDIGPRRLAASDRGREPSSGGVVVSAQMIERLRQIREVNRGRFDQFDQIGRSSGGPPSTIAI